MQTHYSLRLLGGFEVLRDGKRLSDDWRSKMRALLAYLAVESDRAHTRHALGVLLWPEQDEEHARQCVRQALTSLRSALGDQDGPGSLIRVNHESIGLNPDCAYDLDVAVLNPPDSVMCTPEVLRSRTACRRCHEIAAAHYRGSFLAGLSVAGAPEFESWLGWRRQWFDRRATQVFARLAACYEQSGDFERALDYARAQLRLDAWNEEAHRQVMRLLAMGGRRHAALTHYQHFRVLLADELGVEPERETRALYERACAGPIEPVRGLPVERLLRPDLLAARVCPVAPAGHAGERRLLTVLSCEVRCAPEDDPEDLHENCSGSLLVAASVVRQHGGHVVESDGIGLTAYFGYPESCDEPSLRAVRAGLALCDSLPGEQRLRTRVHTDFVFVPPRLKGPCDSDASFVGAAPRLARALQGAATDVDLAISGNTYQLVRDAIECREMGSHTLAGVPQAIALHEVLRVLDPPGRVAPAPSDPASGIPEPGAECWPRGREVPLKITERVAAMLDRLDRAKALVQLASSLGPTFSERQLARMLSQVRNLGLDRPTLAGELERLEELGILQFDSDVSPSRYRFRQPIVRAVAYQSQSKAQRRLYEKLFAQLEAEAEICSSS
jgi:DNA-binding SARP family transcriptional activator/class 3 adenylate cyclase